jgi:uncharacterized repeat protein (TIGR01451 family)
MHTAGIEFRVNARAHWHSPATLLALGAMIAAIVYAPADSGPADLAISKADAPDPVLAGGTLTYTIQVANLGPQGVGGVKVDDKLPGHVAFVSATASSGSCTHKGKGVTCNLGTIAADPTKANAVTVTIRVRPAKAGTIVNTATVDGAGSDPVAANDRAQASTTVVAAPQVPSCRGVTATVIGTRKADRLAGTGGPDVIAAFGGNDAIFGLAGRDLVCAGSGNDRVRAGSAADRLFGGPGGDVLRGGRGNDRLRGGRGFDACFGGAGRDRERGCER